MSSQLIHHICVFLSACEHETASWICWFQISLSGLISGDKKLPCFTQTGSVWHRIQDCSDGLERSGFKEAHEQQMISALLRALITMGCQFSFRVNSLSRAWFLINQGYGNCFRVHIADVCQIWVVSSSHGQWEGLIEFVTLYKHREERCLLLHQGYGDQNYLNYLEVYSYSYYHFTFTSLSAS